jgi:hypothetical protein
VASVLVVAILDTNLTSLNPVLARTIPNCEEEDFEPQAREENMTTLIKNLCVHLKCVKNQKKKEL